MKKILAVIITVLISLQGKSQSIISKVSNDEIEEIKAWHYLLGLNDRSSVLLWADKHRTKLSIRRFDKDAKMIFEKTFWELNSDKKGKVEISGIYEINHALVLFMSFHADRDIKFFKLIIDPKTGEKISEEEVISYVGLEKDYLKYENYFFDFTKDDSLKIYNLMTFVRTKDNNNELKIITFSYNNHKPINSFSKDIPISSPRLLRASYFISSIQEGKNYYFVIENNHLVKEGKKESYLPNLVIYKVAGSKCEELPFAFEKTPDHTTNTISGQFTIDHNKNVKLAISNNYQYKDDVFNAGMSDVYVLSLSKTELVIAKKYEVMQPKLHEKFKNLENIQEKKKRYFLNYLVSFYTNIHNEDELIFQSCEEDATKAAVITKIEDIGVFDFNAEGKISNFNILPLKYQIAPNALYKNSLSFQYNIWEKGNTSQYYEFYPYANLFKHIEFITYKGKTFMFYNDLAENLNATNNSEVKEFSKISLGNGMVAITTKQGIKRSSIFNIEDHVYFDFSSASFNEETGLFSVIAYKNNKAYISYLDLN